MNTVCVLASCKLPATRTHLCEQHHAVAFQRRPYRAQGAPWAAAKAGIK